MTTIALLHTADVHVETFDRLFAEAAPDVRLVHTVRPDWLAAARANGLTDDLSTMVSAHLVEVAGGADAVLCTCSSLGPLADQTSVAHPKVLRADRPMMRRAVATAGTVIVAMCVESTRAPTLDLLRSAFEEAGRPEDFEAAMCGDAWPFFEAGEIERFGREIARLVLPRVAQIANPGCVVLAQPSMAAAEPFLSEAGVPVFSSPALAAQAAIDLVR